MIHPQRSHLGLKMLQVGALFKFFKDRKNWPENEISPKENSMPALDLL